MELILVKFATYSLSRDPKVKIDACCQQFRQAKDELSYKLFKKLLDCDKSVYYQYTIFMQCSERINGVTYMS